MNVGADTDEEQHCLNVTTEYSAMEIVATFLVIL
jgi:hypothetical protein